MCVSSLFVFVCIEVAYLYYAYQQVCVVVGVFIDMFIGMCCVHVCTVVICIHTHIHTGHTVRTQGYLTTCTYVNTYTMYVCVCVCSV